MWYVFDLVNGMRCVGDLGLRRTSDSWKSELNLPHILSRCEGELRASKSLNDIVTVLTCLDENLKLKCLLKYVADSPDYDVFN